MRILKAIFSTKKESNFSYIAGTFLILYYFSGHRIDVNTYINYYDYFKIAALSIVLISLPSFIVGLQSSNSWLFQKNTQTIIILLALSALGILVGYNVACLNYIIIALAVLLFIKELYTFIFRFEVITLVSTGLFLFFFAVIFYAQKYHFPFFTEKVILGLGNHDTLYHTSISNVFSTYLVPSTGFDGVNLVKYHWGSHLLFAGYKNLISINTVIFYNLAYPALFIPLFFQSIATFSSSIVGTQTKFNSITVILVSSIAYFGFSGSLAESTQPLLSESFAISLLFAFLLLGAIYEYSKSKICNKLTFSFIFFVFLILLFISFVKISTGLLITLSIGFIMLRTFKRWSEVMFSLVLFIIGIFLIKNLSFPDDRITAEIIDNYKRWSNFWLYSNGYISYFSGLLIVFLILIKYDLLNNWKAFTNAIKNKELLELEFIMILIISSLILGYKVVADSSDVFYVATVQLFITLPFIIAKIHHYIFKENKNYILYKIFILCFIFLSVLAKPYFTIESEVINNNDIKLKSKKYDENQLLMKQLIDELFLLDKLDNKKTYCIYIPHSENWYYNSQSWANGVASIMVVPAFSGLVHIDGLSPTTREKNFVNYGYYFYMNKEKMVNNTLIEAQKRALNFGFSNLIVLKRENNTLIKKIIKLK